MVTRVQLKMAIMKEINDRLPDVEPIYRPSPFQYSDARDWVNWEDGADPDGWFLGTCPLEKDKRRKKHLARFNFFKGVMQCGEGCHDDKGNFISLVNVRRLT